MVIKNHIDDSFFRKRFLMKNKFLICILLLVFSCDVYAVSKDASIGSDMNQYQCSAFQDDKMYISGDAYFGRCMEATCNGKNWEMSYYDSSRNVTCTNGNLNPYTSIVKNGCSRYQNNNTCSGTTRKYCTTITYFDCTKTAPNGDNYQPSTTTKITTRTTTRVTTKITTTTKATTTQPVKNNNTYLYRYRF